MRSQAGSGNRPNTPPEKLASVKKPPKYVTMKELTPAMKKAAKAASKKKGR